LAQAVSNGKPTASTFYKGTPKQGISLTQQLQSLKKQRNQDKDDVKLLKVEL
jgi:hypothetical protein